MDRASAGAHRGARRMESESARDARCFSIMPAPSAYPRSYGDSGIMTFS